VPECPLANEIEACAYFVTAEALTNVAKYAQASSATVQLTLEDDRLRVEVRDDGVGGADPSTGTGLRGLRDRVDALDGDLAVDSPPGGGTTVTVEVPVR
jgi:signal transduction histidine kinase